MDNYIELKKSFWKDAAVAGAVLGAALVLINVAELYASGTSLKWLVTLVNLMAMAGLTYYFTRKRSLLYGSQGFTFSQSMGYIIAMMLFAGFIAGIGSWVLMNFVAPEQYEEAMQAALENNPFYDPDSRDAELTEKMLDMFKKSAVFNIIGGVFGTIIYGGIVGLIISAFVKRTPDIFAGNNTLNE